MKRQRISSTTAMMMHLFAWIAYGANFLLEITGIGLVFTTIFMMFVYSCFALWFIFKGINVFSPKLIGNFAFGAMVSAIPIINLFYISLDKKTGIPTPGIRKNIGRVIYLIQEEDRKFNESQNAKREFKVVEKTALEEQQYKMAQIEKVREQQQIKREAEKDLYDKAA